MSALTKIGTVIAPHRTLLGSVVFVVGCCFGASVQNAELHESEHSEDPSQQAMTQIVAMVTQERSALTALNNDRLAEMSGLTVTRPVENEATVSSFSLFGVRFGDHADEDQQAADMVQSANFAPIDVSSSNFDRSMLDSMPVVTSNDPEWRCLAEALYFEARSESIAGQLAVGEVILNRVDSNRFPDSVCGVVEQGAHRLNACQFSYNCDGKAEHFTEQVAFERAGKLADMMLDGTARILTDGATYYHADTVSPSWARQFQRTAVIGDHYFYRN